MKKLINLMLLVGSVFIAGLLIQSCSGEENCEGIICENGTCQDDGTCLCDEGWMGQECSQRDLSGDYFMVGYTTIACPDFFDTDFQGDGSSVSLCGVVEEFSICYEFTISLNTNLSYVGNWALFLDGDDGSVETIYDIRETGTWSLDGAANFRTVATGDTGFKIYEFDGRDQWVIANPTPDGGVGCVVREAYVKE